MISNRVKKNNTRGKQSQQTFINLKLRSINNLPYMFSQSLRHSCCQDTFQIKLENSPVGFYLNCKNKRSKSKLLKNLNEWIKLCDNCLSQINQPNNCIF